MAPLGLAAGQGMSSLLWRHAWAVPFLREDLPGHGVALGPPPSPESGRGKASTALALAGACYAWRGTSRKQQVRLRRVPAHGITLRSTLGAFTVGRRLLPLRRNQDSLSMNHGFMYLKPHANTEVVRKLLPEHLRQFRVNIVDEGSIDAEEISRRRVVDVHYGTMAMKAVGLRPHELIVSPQAMLSFEAAFGMSWIEALQGGYVYNAAEALTRLNHDDKGLAEEWDTLEMGVDKVKLGGGCYCGRIRGIYVINGFYMAMRREYVKPGASVYWYRVQWRSSDLRWHRFRTEVVGDTHPELASSNSFRGNLHRRWKELGLKHQPDVGRNVLHASASPFEALAEGRNWLGLNIHETSLGRLLLEKGISRQTLEKWAEDPIVTTPEGSRASLFDILENLDTAECLQIALACGGVMAPKEAPMPLA